MNAQREWRAVSENKQKSPLPSLFFGKHFRLYMGP